MPAHRDRARAAGVDVSEIGIRAGQARTYTVDDPEGHRWYFGEPLEVPVLRLDVELLNGVGWHVHGF